MKLDLKNSFTKFAKTDLPQALEIGGGMVLSAKFLNQEAVQKMFPKANPEDWYMKHMGALKFVLFGLLSASMPSSKKNDPIKNILLGAALEGLIKEVAVLSVQWSKDGKPWFNALSGRMGNWAVDPMNQAQYNSVAALPGNGIFEQAPVMLNAMNTVAGAQYPPLGEMQGWADNSVASAPNVGMNIGCPPAQMGRTSYMRAA